MEKRKLNEKMSVMEAVDNLSTFAELDLSSLPEPTEMDLGIKPEKRAVDWRDPAHVMKNRDAVRETFRVVHSYLEHLYEKEKGQLKDRETQKGIQAIMVLAGEAAEKMDKYTSLFKGVHEPERIINLKEYQDLQNFYRNKIVKRFHETLEAEESWQKEWGNLEEDKLDVERRGLKDLETVRRDKEYELFYITKENGHPFFNRNLLRHIRMVGEFDESVSDPEGDDPLLKTRYIRDREIHEGAKEILQSVAPYLDEFYREALRHKENPLIASLNKAIMALMLAANGRNLLSTTSLKCCLNYFFDFHQFLREALQTEEYERLYAQSHEASHSFGQIALNLLHELCSYFFLRTSRIKETGSFIQELIAKGKKESGVDQEGVSSVSLWNTLLEEDEEMRNVLKHYPNGPLLLTLDLFREGEEKVGFDPLAQGNFPTHLYATQFDTFHLSLLRIPAPVHQAVINKAEVVKEFNGFLRGLKTRMKGQKHLLVNLQDRTAWQEHARSLVLENLPKKAEFSETLSVVTLCKNTDFYHQSSHYQSVSDAKEFIALFKEQIVSGEACGYSYPSALSQEEIASFTEHALHMIHELFFAGKNVLSRKNRLDFIEIFYQFFIVKLLLVLRPDSLSFTCKDGIDTGAAASAGFFAFLRMMSSNKSWTQEEKETFQWLLYAPALLIRERLIDSARFSRMISALTILHSELETQEKRIKDAVHKLFGQALFQKLHLRAA